MAFKPVSSSSVSYTSAKSHIQMHPRFLTATILKVVAIAFAAGLIAGLIGGALIGVVVSAIASIAAFKYFTSKYDEYQYADYATRKMSDYIT